MTFIAFLFITFFFKSTYSFSENSIIMSETEAEAEKEKVVDITEDEEIDFGSEARKIINALNVLGNGKSKTLIVLMLKGH